jgi:hypothetical protein
MMMLLWLRLATDKLNAINALKTGRDLTNIHNWCRIFLYLKANLEPITPSNVTVKSATRRGSKA